MHRLLDKISLSVINVANFCCISANFPEDVVSKLPAAFATGVYYGWAKVDDGSVEKMVMSVGWNPFYQNQKKSMVGWCCSVAQYFQCSVQLRC